MKLANVQGRAALVFDDAIADIVKASGGRFGADPMNVFENWTAFVDFAHGVSAGDSPVVETQLRCPVPNPRQVPRSASTTAVTRKSQAWPFRGSGHVHEVPGVARRPFRRCRNRR